MRLEDFQSVVTSSWVNRSIDGGRKIVEDDTECLTEEADLAREEI